MTEPLEVQVGQLLLLHHLTLATAESCTGGLLGHRLTNIPGSSAYYLGGVVAYAYEAKKQVLGVPAATLTTYGAVSAETAREMATGVRRVLGADIGVSVTGIAGPGGGLPGKPVGLVWIALAAAHYSKAQSFVWGGNRLENKEQSAEAALELVRLYLMSLSQKAIA